MNTTLRQQHNASCNTLPLQCLIVKQPPCLSLGAHGCAAPQDLPLLELHKALGTNCLHRRVPGALGLLWRGAAIEAPQRAVHAARRAELRRAKCKAALTLVCGRIELHEVY